MTQDTGRKPITTVHADCATAAADRAVESEKHNPPTSGGIVGEFYAQQDRAPIQFMASGLPDLKGGK